MTYSLPFGLKQKPLNHYFEHGVIRFSVNEGKLFFTVKAITKLTNGIIQQSEVKSKLTWTSFCLSKPLVKYLQSRS